MYIQFFFLIDNVVLKYISIYTDMHHNYLHIYTINSKSRNNIHIKCIVNDHNVQDSLVWLHNKITIILNL